MKKLILSTALVAATAVALVLAASSSAAVPKNTATPTLGGTAQVGSTLTASDGAWSNSPTSYSYQWQRCKDDGTGCANISGATSKTYTLVADDLGHTVRVMVVAGNTDGTASAVSDPTVVVSSANGPKNNVKPNLGGGSKVGDTLVASNGLWTPTPTSYSRQWQRCDTSGANCRDIVDATSQTYNVGSADVGHRVRALVTAKTADGQTTMATAASAVVSTSTTTTTNTTTTTLTTTNTVTTVMTTTAPAPLAPVAKVLSLRRVHNRLVVRYRVCAQHPGYVRITQREVKARALPARQRFRVYAGGCTTRTKSVLLLKRFRSRGRLLVTLRAQDATGRLSRLAERSIVLR